MTKKSGTPAVGLIASLAGLLILAGCTGKVGFNPIGCGNSCPPQLPSPAFLYATSPNHVLGFKIDQATGALSAPTIVAGPSQSTGITGTISRGHLYVSDFLNDTVDGFSIDSSTGALTSVTGSPFSLGGTPLTPEAYLPLWLTGHTFTPQEQNGRNNGKDFQRQTRTSHEPNSMAAERSIQQDVNWRSL